MAHIDYTRTLVIDMDCTYDQHINENYDQSISRVEMQKKMQADLVILRFKDGKTHIVKDRYHTVPPRKLTAQQFIEKHFIFPTLGVAQPGVKLRDTQKNILDGLIIGASDIRCARQEGKTTTSIAYLLHEALTKDRSKVVFVASKHICPAAMLGRAMAMLGDLRSEIADSTSTSILFKNGSQFITTRASTTDIGNDVDRVVIDEPQMLGCQDLTTLRTKCYGVVTTTIGTAVAVDTAPVAPAAQVNTPLSRLSEGDIANTRTKVFETIFTSETYQWMKLQAKLDMIKEISRQLGA